MSQHKNAFPPQVVSWAEAFLYYGTLKSSTWETKRLCNILNRSQQGHTFNGQCLISKKKGANNPKIQLFNTSIDTIKWREKRISTFCPVALTESHTEYNKTRNVCWRGRDRWADSEVRISIRLCFNWLLIWIPSRSKIWVLDAFYNTVQYAFAVIGVILFLPGDNGGFFMLAASWIVTLPPLAIDCWLSPISQ